MKYVAPLAISIVLFGCQNTQEKQDVKNNSDIQYNVELATPFDIAEALEADETASVIHPIDDSDITLNEEPAVVVNNLWHYLRDNMAFDVPQNSRVIEQRDWYASHNAYLERVAKRAQPFFYYIIKSLEENDIPLEIALLPIVESAFDPFAYSHGRASGMWQFVPETGERFGMEQNWWYDGRRDVVASTSGAISYLKYLNKMFDGDWLLALAAYNSGEGRVMRAVKSNKRKGLATDFWSLDLPKETRAYVPKLLALADLVKRPEHFNISWHAIDNNEAVEIVEIDGQIDLAKAAELAELTLGKFQRLNPGFNRWATAPDGPNYLLLPKAKVDIFNNNIAQMTPEDRLSWTRYQIKNGDSLSVIAKKYNSSVKLIQQVNNIKNNQIRAGQYLLIPVASESLSSYALSQNQRLAKTQNIERKGLKSEYIVKKGDSMWDISRAHNVNYKTLAKWNGMAPTDPIKPGQKLIIWQQPVQNNKHPAENIVMRNITYRVRSGDSLARIANKFQVSIKNIEDWNNLSRDNYLQPGQMLKLSVDVTNI